MKNGIKILAITLLYVALSSQALTLGRIQGAAALGKPLNLVVPIQLDAGEDAASLCFAADVFHADAPQDASRVRVRVEATAQARIANLRILSSALVDEPVVTLYLRTSCGQKATRRYVLLTDVPSEIVAAPGAVAPVAAAPLSAPPALTPALPVPERPSATAATAPTPPVPTAKVQSASKQAVRAKPASKHVKAKATSSNRTASKHQAGKIKGQPRLKLDSLELLSERITNLESSTRAAPTDDTLRNNQKVQTLETQMSALRALTARNQTSLVDLTARLQQAQSERFPGASIYALITLLLASLTALAYLWNRQRPASVAGANWWNNPLGQPEAALPESEANSSATSDPFQRAYALAPTPVPAPAPVPATAAPTDAPVAGEATVSALPKRKPAGNLDMDLSDMFGNSAFSALSTSALAPPPLLPDEPTAKAQVADARVLQSSSNLIDFDLPQTPRKPGPK